MICIVNLENTPKVEACANTMKPTDFAHIEEQCKRIAVNYIFQSLLTDIHVKKLGLFSELLLHVPAVQAMKMHPARY